MERICSFQSQTVTTVPTSLSSLSKHGFNLKAYERNQFLRFPSFLKYPNARKFGFLDVRARPSGPVKASSEAVEASPKKLDSKEKDLAFVAGATGKVGSRTVRELLKLGFRVRAGVRSAQRAEILVESVKQMKLENAIEGIQSVEKLEIVECDLEKRDRIRPALGNASIVICCIGASEKEISDITGPYRIDFQATKNLIDAATVAKVDHFILVTSLGTKKFGFPAAILNLFWGVLIWKRKAEEALLASGLPYTIVRPGGMERPTDTYKETHNITLSEEDTLFGGQVSNLQVAELIACMAKNPKLSYCKVVEVIAETTAPLTPMEKLLEKIPSKRPYFSPQTEPVAATDPGPAPSKTVIEEPKITPEDIPAKAKSVEAKPLSPYAAYDDLKPPTSPTPSPSTSKSDITADSLSSPNASATETRINIETSVIETTPATKSARPLSPYAVYEDFKPPTSPSPTASGLKEDVSQMIGGNDVPETTIAKDTSSNSPYQAYGDLKPPTSPSPSSLIVSESPVNGVSKTSVSSGSDTAQQTSLADKRSDEENQTSSKPKPLSPYAMYEDLKPPASPIPLPSKSH